jgi:hypothetical protein
VRLPWLAKPLRAVDDRCTLTTSQGLDELTERAAALLAAADEVRQHDRRVPTPPRVRPRLDRPRQQPQPTQEQHERHERQHERHEEKSSGSGPVHRHGIRDRRDMPSTRYAADWQRQHVGHVIGRMPVGTINA